MGVCVSQISGEDSIIASKVMKTGGFSLTEWDDEVYLMMTRLEDGATWDETNSGMYHKETYYYNREDDKGNFAGRVPVKDGTTWKLLFLNYDKENAQTVVVEYGNAAGLVATTLGLVASALTFLM